MGLIPIEQHAILEEYGQPVEHGDFEFGASEIGFCLEKMRLMRILQKPKSMNGRMFLGKIFHTLLPNIVKHHPYFFAHGSTKSERYRNRKKAPRYEVEIRVDIGKEWSILAHCDCDLPALDTIIEFKTTTIKKEWTSDDGLLQAYALQANCYAMVLGRKNWEIWILYTEFTDSNKPFITIIKGQTDKKLFQDYVERVENVYAGIKNNTQLVGPEFSWECKYCHLFTDCGYWSDNIAIINKLLPCDKKQIPEVCLPTFDKMYYRKMVFFDRPNKVWRIKTDSEEYVESDSETSP